ncbi:MAG: PadR family transcriptional regulator [Bacillota bacterium]
MNKTYNHTTYALLGILTTDCRTGYEIKQLIDQSLNHFWKISYGQIYPTLKKLVADELATVTTTTQDGKPDRKEYTLTAEGKKALQEWLEQPLQQIPVERNEVILKLFFSRHQRTEHTLTLLQDYKQKLQERYETYQSIEHMIKGSHLESADANYWLYTLDYGKRMTKATMEWCEVTKGQINQEED